MNREGLGSVLNLRQTHFAKGGRPMLGPSVFALGRRLLAIAVVGLVAVAALVGPAAGAPTANRFDQINVVSDLPGVAAIQDPLLVNPWGLALSPTSPLWVANNGTGTATLYRGDGGGNPFVKVGLEVTVTNGAPTGQVFNGTTSFQVPTPAGPRPAVFIFDSQTGDITGWNPANGTTAVVAAHSDDAIYTGLALLQTPSGPFLLAADFRHARIDVFDGNWNRVDVGSAFTDPALPSGYAPFNVQVLGGAVYVSYAKQDADGEEEIAGHNLGFVNKFTDFGQAVQRIASRGNLNAPWGLAIAPASFGKFAGALLVGNFGDGKIGAYTDSGDFLGFLRDRNNDVLSIDGLWALLPGTAASGGTTAVWFSAGPEEETHGLLGIIRPAG
jgi:uncharacterized protein (TIGR03118 family)